MSGDSGKSQIHGGILRRPLPESDQVGFGFVETPGVVAVAQRSSQAELVLRIGGLAREGGAVSGNGIVVATAASCGETLRVESAPARLLIGVVAGDEMTDGGEPGSCGESEDQQDNRRGARNQFWEPPRHISYHDIIFDV